MSQESVSHYCRSPMNTPFPAYLTISDVICCMERYRSPLQELEILFVEQCRDRPMYGSHFFYSLKVQCVPDLLSNLPNNLLLAFNADGMHIFSVDKKELLQQYSYADVHSWRGTRRQVSLTIWDQDTDSVFELALKTQQASDMASIILDHINAIMANAGRN
ncbi:unnamed protein product [Ectocarpus sp. 4 AP-2014]